MQTLFQKWELPLARFAIFTVYFWFGSLKLLGESPATPLVQQLFDKTIGFMSFGTFYFMFACFEMLIGIFFLIKGLERWAIVLLAIHLVTTVLPLFLLTGIAWHGLMVPTLEGQYIIKNILILALAVVIGARTKE